MYHIFTPKKYFQNTSASEVHKYLYRKYTNP